MESSIVGHSGLYQDSSGKEIAHLLQMSIRRDFINEDCKESAMNSSHN